MRKKNYKGRCEKKFVPNGARYSNKDYTEWYLSGGTGVVAYNPENSNHVWYWKLLEE